jgi:hypothetical protein
MLALEQPDREMCGMRFHGGECCTACGAILDTQGRKEMEIYTIKRGVMRQVPEDFEFKQLVKYIFAFVIGLVIGNFWPHLQ